MKWNKPPKGYVAHFAHMGDAWAEPPAPPKSATDISVFDVGNEDGNIPPREWLLGTTFCRRILSGLIAAGAGGKTTLRIVQYLSLASGRRLTGEHVFVRARVLVVCLEDDMHELRRRVRAAMLHYGIEPADVGGYLFLTTPRGLKIAERGGERGAKIVRGGLYRLIAELIDEKQLDLVSIDPTIKAHSLQENENSEIDEFATFLTGLAVEKNIAIDLLSHERKGSGEAGDVNRGRGATAQKDAARLVYTLTRMSEEDAAPFGLGPEERRSLVRLDSAKVNIAPPSAKATWFRFVGVEIGNPSDLYPHGDTVQTVEPWTPPGMFEGLSDADLNAVLRRLGAGMSDGRRFSTSAAAKDRAAWHAVKDHFPSLADEHCKAIVAAWNRNGVFEIGDYEDPTRREKAKGILSAKLIGPLSDP